MSNIFRVSETSPDNEWLVMSNQGTGCFLDLLICAADTMERTAHQEELITFLKDQKDINDIAPGTAGFDLDEMPWHGDTFPDDIQFLLSVTESAGKQLPCEVNEDIVLPWLEQFSDMIRQMRRYEK
ncbi:MAG: hypothetical protein IKG15_04295 [Solobacterium sp.]|nr:hypothetical protein [Solobacterium sp.]